MTKTPLSEAILYDLVELLDIDEDQLTSPTRLFTSLPESTNNGFVPDAELNGREVKIIGTHNIFWIFPSLESAEEANKAYAYWLVINNKITISDQVILDAIDSSLVTQYVQSIVMDNEEVEKLASKDTKEFWKIATTNFNIFPDDQSDLTKGWVDEKFIKQLKTAFAKYMSTNPTQYLIDKIGEKEAIKLLINGVGFNSDGFERLAESIVSEDSLKPLNIRGEIGQTRYGFAVIQVIGKPIPFTDLTKIQLIQLI